MLLSSGARTCWWLMLERACLRAYDVLAMQKPVHLGPGYAAPDQPQPCGVGVPKRGDIGDPGPLQAFGHLGADARDIPYLQVKDGAGQLLNRQNDQPIRLLHVGSELGQQLVRRNADRARQAFSDLALDFALDVLRQLCATAGSCCTLSRRQATSSIDMTSSTGMCLSMAAKIRW